MTSTQLDGNDISKWQGLVDWAQAKQQTGFEMVKATQGTAEVDPDYARNIEALRAAGEMRGSYHYPNAGDPAAEAEFYVTHAARRNGEMQALDFEGAVLGLKDPVGWAAAFLARVIELTSNRPLIYMSASVVTRFDWSRVVKLNVGLWCASWDSPPLHHIGQWPFVIMWQRDDHGTLRGIRGLVDEDVFFGDAKVWQAYANNFTPPPHPPTPPPPPPAPKPPAPTPPPAQHTHTVVAGDTLDRIALDAHTTVAELVKLNEHKYPSLAWNPNVIQVGWVLILPGAPAPPPAPHIGYYRVVAGDTLDSIAAKFHTTVTWLLARNPIVHDPNMIDAGWILRVP